MASKTYVVRHGFMLGHPLNQALRKGDVLEINGSLIRHQGADISMPAIRGAIIEKWLIPADSPDGQHLIQEMEQSQEKQEAGFSHMSTRKGASKTVAEADGIDVTGPRTRRPRGPVETDADRTVGELKTPTQRGEFIVNT